MIVGLRTKNVFLLLIEILGLGYSKTQSSITFNNNLTICHFIIEKKA